MEPSNGKPETTPPREHKRDHPIWGLLMLAVVCVTGLLMVQMITDYHW